MNARTAHTLFFCLHKHCFQMVDMRMHVSVGKQTDKMHGAAVFAAGGSALPGFTFKHSAAFDGFADQLCTLAEYLPGAERIVPDLAIAHIVVGGEPHRRSVRLQLYPWVLCQKPFQNGHIRSFYGVAVVPVSKADAVHHDGENRTADSFKTVQFFQFHILNLPWFCKISIHGYYTARSKRMQDFSPLFHKFARRGTLLRFLVSFRKMRAAYF